MNAFSVLQDDVEDAASVSSVASEEKPAPVAAKPPAAQKEVKDADVGATEKPAEPVEEEEPAMSFAEYQVKKAELAASVASLAPAKKNIRKANDGKDGFAKMTALKKHEDGDETADADASSLLSAVTLKAPPTQKGLKDSTQAAVLDNVKVQQFFKDAPRGGRGGPRGGFSRGGFRGGRGGSGDARRGNFNGGGYSSGYQGNYGGAPQRDFRDPRQFTQKANGDEVAPAAGNTDSGEPNGDVGGRGGFANGGGFRGGYRGRGGPSNGYRGRGGRGRGGYGGYNGDYNNRRGGYHHDGPGGRPKPAGGAPNMDDQSAFPSLA